MEEVDIYSNMLYVMDKKAKLGKLAHEYAEIDHNRAEVCCLIGLSSGSGLRCADGFRELLLFEIRPYESDNILQAITHAQPRISPSMDIDGT